MTLEMMKQKTGKNTESADYTAEKTVDKIKSIAENIRYYSVIAKQTTRAVRESGAIPELAAAIREAAIAARDTAKDIRQTAAELNESGAIADTTRAVVEAKRATQDTIHTVMDAVDTARHQMK